jgi:hypothetical protein
MSWSDAEHDGAYSSPYIGSTLMPKRTGRPFEPGWCFGADPRSTWRGVVRVLYASQIEYLSTDCAECWRDVTAPATRLALEAALSESVEAVEAVEHGAGRVHTLSLSLAGAGGDGTARIFLAAPSEGAARVCAVTYADRLVMLDGEIKRGRYILNGVWADKMQAALEPYLWAAADATPIPHLSTPTYASLRKQMDGGAGYLEGGGLGMEIESARAVIEGDGDYGRYLARLRRLLARPTVPKHNIARSAADHSPRRKDNWNRAYDTVRLEQLRACESR